MSSQKDHNIVEAVRQLLAAVAGLAPSSAATKVQRAAGDLRDKMGLVGYDIRG